MTVDASNLLICAQLGSRRRQKECWGEQRHQPEHHYVVSRLFAEPTRARGARTTATFRAFDEDGDGRINFSEMKLALNSLLGLADGNTIAEETVAHVFRAFDTSPAYNNHPDRPSETPFSFFPWRAP